MISLILLALGSNLTFHTLQNVRPEPSGTYLSQIIKIKETANERKKSTNKRDRATRIKLVQSDHEPCMYRYTKIYIACIAFRP